MVAQMMQRDVQPLRRNGLAVQAVVSRSASLSAVICAQAVAEGCSAKNSRSVGAAGGGASKPISESWPDKGHSHSMVAGGLLETS
jgi:hypothetical protein